MVFEDVPGAETWAEHVSENLSSREELCWMKKFKHYGTIAKADAKLVLCLVAWRILQLRDEMWQLFYFPALPSHEQRPARVRTGVCDCFPSLQEGKVMKRKWKLTNINRWIGTVWGGNLSFQALPAGLGGSAPPWAVPSSGCRLSLCCSLTCALSSAMCPAPLGSAGLLRSEGLQVVVVHLVWCSYGHRHECFAGDFRTLYNN